MTNDSTLAGMSTEFWSDLCKQNSPVRKDRPKLVSSVDPLSDAEISKLESYLSGMKNKPSNSTIDTKIDKLITSEIDKLITWSFGLSHPSETAKILSMISRYGDYGIKKKVFDIYINKIKGTDHYASLPSDSNVIFTGSNKVLLSFPCNPYSKITCEYFAAYYNRRHNKYENAISVSKDYKNNLIVDLSDLFLINQKELIALLKNRSCDSEYTVFDLSKICLSTREEIIAMLKNSGSVLENLKNKLILFNYERWVRAVLGSIFSVATIISIIPVFAPNIGIPPATVLFIFFGMPCACAYLGSLIADCDENNYHHEKKMIASMFPYALINEIRSQAGACDKPNKQTSKLLSFINRISIYLSLAFSTVCMQEQFLDSVKNVNINPNKCQENNTLINSDSTIDINKATKQLNYSILNNSTKIQKTIFDEQEQKSKYENMKRIKKQVDNLHNNTTNTRIDRTTKTSRPQFVPNNFGTKMLQRR